MARRPIPQAPDAFGGELSSEEDAYFQTRGNEMPGEGTAVGEEPPAGVPPPTEPPPESNESDELAEPAPEPSPAERGLIGDLQHERSERQQLQEQLKARDEELNQHREMRARIDERLRIAAETRASQEQAARQATRPDPESDPIGHIRWQNEELQKRVEQQDQYMRQQADYLQKQQAAQVQSTAAYQRIAQVNTLAQQFTHQQPDYPNAYNHLIGFRDRELQIMGYRDPAQRQSILQNEAQMISDAALAEGVNPAQRVYELAQAVGYRNQAVPAGPGYQVPLDNGNQRLPPPSAQDRVANLQRGVRASRTMSNAPGVAGNSPYTLQRLATMPQEEFDTLYARDPSLVDGLYKQMN